MHDGVSDVCRQHERDDSTPSRHKQPVRVQTRVESEGLPHTLSFALHLQSMEHFEDIGPCVVLASPGMLQSGLSRELFEQWCSDPKNGCVVAGYCVEGTLAKAILSEPEEITAMNGARLPMRLQVAYISFSAHTDYRQTSEFVRALRPPHIVLVHGEMNEMNRLKAAITREYEDDVADARIDVYNPANTQAVELNFRGEKTAKVVGSLATVPPVDGQIISGVLVRRNFNYHLMAPADLPREFNSIHCLVLAAYTDLSHSTLTQRQSVFYSGTVELLLYFLQQVAGDVKRLEETTDAMGGSKTTVSVFCNEVKVTIEAPVVYLEWLANPVNDMYADAALAAVLQAEANPIPTTSLCAIRIILVFYRVTPAADDDHIFVGQRAKSARVGGRSAADARGGAHRVPRRGRRRRDRCRRRNTRRRSPCALPNRRAGGGRRRGQDGRDVRQRAVAPSAHERAAPNPPMSRARQE